MEKEFDPGSFRDPKGQIYKHHGRIFRKINHSGYQEFKQVLDTGLLQKLVAEEKLVPFEIVDKDTHGSDDTTAMLLEHTILPFISYPYEWTFHLLKAAAILQLEIAIESLDSGVFLSDATAYNIQFNGTKPIFIDHLSFRPYSEGEFWSAHSQFCEQFLNPLLMRSKLGICHNHWYRGSMDGVATVDLNRMLPLHKKLSWNTFTQVYLQAQFQNRSTIKNEGNKNLTSKALPAQSLKNLLQVTLSWIQKLEPKGQKGSVWSNYTETRTYSSIATENKSKHVESYIQRHNVDSLIDLGCNSGEFSEIALRAGAKRITAYDFDHMSLDNTYQRARSSSLNILPLYLDITNPPPNQGWRQSERLGMMQRTNSDGLLALALIHHLAIGKNIPLEQVIDWLLSLSVHGLIEFVPKSDVMVKSLLQNREDIFPEYTLENFRSIMKSKASILSEIAISNSDRVLFEYLVDNQGHNNPSR